MNTTFHCPQCGGIEFETLYEVKSLDDYDGAKCTECGHVICSDDIIEYGGEFAAKQLNDAIRKAGLS